MNLRLYSMVGLAIVLGLGSGCGPNTAPSGDVGGEVQAGPNARLKFKPEYKQILSKTGGIKIKPGMIEAYKKQQAAANAKK